MTMLYSFHALMYYAFDRTDNLKVKEKEEKTKRNTECILLHKKCSQVLGSQE
jgi:hypothetical protein